MSGSQAHDSLSLPRQSVANAEGGILDVRVSHLLAAAALVAVGPVTYIPISLCLRTRNMQQAAPRDKNMELQVSKIERYYRGLQLSSCSCMQDPGHHQWAQCRPQATEATKPGYVETVAKAVPVNYHFCQVHLWFSSPLLQ